MYELQYSRATLLYQWQMTVRVMLAGFRWGILLGLRSCVIESYRKWRCPSLEGLEYTVTERNPVPRRSIKPSLRNAVKRKKRPK